LLDAVGIADGDVLTHVDGASLGSTATIEQLLLHLPTANSWSLTIRRWTGSTWVTLDRSIARAP
jgi:type II secretory pathway component PulC